jgi:hypothetical protein
MTDAERKDCSTCKHRSMDSDMQPLCIHPSVLDYHRYGVNLNKSIANFCGPDFRLHEIAGEKEKEGT